MAELYFFAVFIEFLPVPQFCKVSEKQCGGSDHSHMLPVHSCQHIFKLVKLCAAKFSRLFNR